MLKFRVQVVLVYLQPFRRNSRLKCALQPKIAKKLPKPLFWGSRSFSVIDVNKSKKHVTSACYDMQQVCTCLQPFHPVRANNGKITSSEGYPTLTPSFEENPITQGHEILSLKATVL